MKNIAVIGSLNADLMVQVPKLPVPGETLMGKSFEVLPGGKGMNQAVAAAKLGAHVMMCGMVGDDSNGTLLLEQLRKTGVDSSKVLKVEQMSTGTALVTTSEEDNTIVVIPGANGCMDSHYVDSIKHSLKEADMVLLQFEIPSETVYYIIDYCFENDIPVMLDPAPAGEVKEEYLDKITYLILNETELEGIFKLPKEEVLEKHSNKIIMTAGKDGAYFHNGETLMHCKAKTVTCVDATGAGDAFHGAFAVAVLNGKTIEEAVLFANEVAAFTTTKKGAQSAMPDKDHF
ncbi:MAG: ribokinase [Lachnospiraceae bacterium]|nr:ribokinase [Lachnospiraceae bacterium]